MSLVWNEGVKDSVSISLLDIVSSNQSRSKHPHRNKPVVYKMFTIFKTSRGLRTWLSTNALLFQQPPGPGDCDCLQRVTHRNVLCRTDTTRLCHFTIFVSTFAFSSFSSVRIWCFSLFFVGQKRHLKMLPWAVVKEAVWHFIGQTINPLIKKLIVD